MVACEDQPPRSGLVQRCTAGPGLSATSVSNTAGMPPIERQLYGTSTVKIFLLPGS